MESCLPFQLVAFLIGMCYINVEVSQTGIQDIIGLVFSFVAGNSQAALADSLNIFPREMPLFLREYKNGIYRSDTYYLSKMISMVSMKAVGKMLGPHIDGH